MAAPAHPIVRGLVLLSWAALAAAAPAIPKVDLVYPGPSGSMIDRLCPELSKTPIEPRWVEETLRRLPEFQARWDKEGPGYLAVALGEVGLDYPFREVQVTLTVCQALPSMGSPLMIQMGGFLSSNERPLPASIFPLIVFHELMHRYADTHAADMNRLQAGDTSGQIFILLHEIAHELKAVGFVEEGNQYGTDIKKEMSNNDLLWDKCSKTLNAAIPPIN